MLYFMGPPKIVWEIKDFHITSISTIKEYFLVNESFSLKIKINISTFSHLLYNIYYHPWVDLEDDKHGLGIQKQVLEDR